MEKRFPPRLLPLLVVSVLSCLPGPLRAAKPAVTEALKLKPVQEAGLDYDIPAAATQEKCTLDAYKRGGVSGWEVRDPDNKVLRRYLDSNGDNRVDKWCYFKNGIEVYRDIDSDYNKKADQYRWLGTAGSRWALDTDEDGHIDRWKSISPEEVTEEAVLAMRLGDPDRFSLLLLTDQELKSLGLGAEQQEKLAAKLAATKSGFEKLLQTQQVVGEDTHWINFGGRRPGVVPAGTNGAEEDLHIYENVAAVVEQGGTHDQVIIGTLVKVDEVWRMIDLPKSLSEAQAGTAPDGFFFQASLAPGGAMEARVTGGLNPEVQDLISQMEEIDKDLQTASTPQALAPLHARRADVLEKLAEAASEPGDRATWIRQLADTVSAAAQSGEYPEGVQRLAALCDELKEQQAGAELLAYVKYRYLSADYTRNMQQPDADFAKIQQKWLADLEQFVKDFSTHPEASEAMLQLAMAEEFAGNDDDAVTWYDRIAEQFSDTDVAAKAAGAKRRIESVGQPLQLSGTDQDGDLIDVESYRGKVVLVHYWATYYPNCMPGLSVLKDMQAKYGQDNLALVGVNVDSDRAKFQAYLEENPLPWPQLHAPGGLDSPLAQAYGVLVLPTMILADQEGNVVNRNLDAGQVDSELRRLLR